MDPGGLSPEAVTSTYVGPDRRKGIRRNGEDQKKETKIIYNTGYRMLCSLGEQQIS
jgi:hypothetical protein